MKISTAAVVVALVSAGYVFGLMQRQPTAVAEERTKATGALVTAQDPARVVAREDVRSNSIEASTITNDPPALQILTQLH